MRLSVDSLTNVVLVATCVLVGGNAALQMSARLNPPPAASGAEGTYSAGESLPALTEFSYADHKSTLVLVVRSTCKFCTQSMPFYRSLVDKAKASGGKVGIVSVSTEPEPSLKAYLAAHDVTMGAVRSIPADYFKVRGTPTLILVDSEGRVQGSWVGLQDRDGETAILERLGAVN